MFVDCEAWAWKVRLSLGALVAVSFAGSMLTG